ncbi:11177_t:CDS:1, partial [Gigaspora rosea]
HEPGIFISWEECKKQINKYPGALYKKFYTKQQAFKYIEEENVDETDKVIIYTDGYCKKNGTDDAKASIGVFFNDNDSRNLSERLPGKKQTNNRAEIFAIIRALETVNKENDIIIFTDSTYVINCYNVKNHKPNFDLVDRMNDLIKV